MTETELKHLLAAVTPPDEAARAAAHAHWASLAKPLGGLGGLETMLEDAAALTGSAELDLSRRAVLVLCADNGVVAQGVSQTDSSVTRAVAREPCRPPHQRLPDGRRRPTARWCRWIWASRAHPVPGRARLPHCRRHGGLYPRPGYDPR